MKTTAVLQGDSYVINGSKTFITNGVYADYYVVAAKINAALGNKGISIFLMDTNLKGITATKLDKLGWRASDTAEIAFDNVVIPASNLMGEEGKGFPYIMQHFALERLIMAINAHARAEYAMEYTIQYMSQREAFGKTINQFQALRHTLVDHATEIEHCKVFNYAAMARLNKGEYVVKEATMAKLKSTKVADEAIYSCLQMLGGYGYMEEYPMARLLRDSRLGPIGGGTSEILREILSKMIIDKQNYQPAVKH
jgi:alkylation response protein AidB-like acyl-CoA dehydrogenase